LADVLADLPTRRIEHQRKPTGKFDVTDQPNNPIDQPQDIPSQEVAETESVAPEAATEAAESVAPEEVSPADENVEDKVETAAESETTTDQEAAVEETAVEETAVEEAEVEEAEDEEAVAKDWYILKVQSNRETSIREGLMRRIAVAGLDEFFGDVIVPTEKVTEFKGGKKRIVNRKLYPGYLVVNMEINDDTWFLVRETPGIGDFTGAAGRPTAMLPHEVARIVAKQDEKSEKAPKLQIGFSIGDRVKINDGTFENFEGDVDSIDEANGRVTVMINIFGRSTPVELEYWQIVTL
jgi:transcriptional antiterminator NusG